MTEYENVISRLGNCVEYFDGKVNGVMFDEWLEQSRKSIALLKKQTHVNPKQIPNVYGFWCECGFYLGPNGCVNYCAICGRAVRWNDSSN